MKKEKSNLNFEDMSPNSLSGTQVILMSEDIIRREINEHLENKKKEYNLNKDDMKMDDFDSFMKHFSAFADIKGTEMAMDTISLSIATLCYSIAHNVSLHKCADIIEELIKETSAKEFVESVGNTSGKVFEELKARMIKEFNLEGEGPTSNSSIRGVANWILTYMLDICEDDLKEDESEDDSVAQA